MYTFRMHKTREEYGLQNILEQGTKFYTYLNS